MNIRHSQSAFTILEVLISIAVIGVLAAVVILAVNPQDQLRNAQDIKRLADMNAILKAVNQFQIDRSRLPQIEGEEVVLAESDPASKEICRHDSTGLLYPVCDFAGYRYLGELVPIFIAKLPVDPDHDPTDTWGTDYHIWKDEDGRIHVHSPLYGGGAGKTLTQ